MAKTIIQLVQARDRAEKRALKAMRDLADFSVMCACSEALIAADYVLAQAERAARREIRKMAKEKHR